MFGNKVRVQITLRKICEEEIIMNEVDQPRSKTVKIYDKIMKRNQIHIRDEKNTIHSISLC